MQLFYFVDRVDDNKMNVFWSDKFICVNICDWFWKYVILSKDIWAAFIFDTTFIIDVIHDFTVDW